MYFPSISRTAVNQTRDEEQIKEAVFDYYYGVVDSDVKRLEKAFATSVAQLVFPPNHPSNDNDDVRSEPVTDSFKRWLDAEKKTCRR